MTLYDLPLVQLDTSVVQYQHDPHQLWEVDLLQWVDQICSSGRSWRPSRCLERSDSGSVGISPGYPGSAGSGSQTCEAQPAPSGY